jgi:hypothetical protein
LRHREAHRIYAGGGHRTAAYYNNPAEDHDWANDVVAQLHSHPFQVLSLESVYQTKRGSRSDAVIDSFAIQDSNGELRGHSMIFEISPSAKKRSARTYGCRRWFNLRSIRY